MEYQSIYNKLKGSRFLDGAIFLAQLESQQHMNHSISIKTEILPFPSKRGATITSAARVTFRLYPGQIACT